jgi:hypothetical protein
MVCEVLETAVGPILTGHEQQRELAKTPKPKNKNKYSLHVT